MFNICYSKCWGCIEYFHSADCYCWKCFKFNFFIKSKNRKESFWALIAQVFSVYDNRKNRWENNFWLVYFGIAFIICGVFSVFACLDIAPCTELCGVYRAIGIIVWILVILWTLPPDTWLARFATNNYKRYEDNYD